VITPTLPGFLDGILQVLELPVQLGESRAGVLLRMPTAGHLVLQLISSPTGGVSPPVGSKEPAKQFAAFGIPRPSLAAQAREHESEKARLAEVVGLDGRFGYRPAVTGVAQLLLDIWLSRLKTFALRRKRREICGRLFPSPGTGRKTGDGACNRCSFSGQCIYTDQGMPEVRYGALPP
jgi:hypothetical protein